MKEVRFYLPTMTKDGHYIGRDTARAIYNGVSHSMALWFGGVTETLGHGVWHDKDGNVMEERVTILSSYAEEDDVQDHHQDLKDLATWVRDEAKQECVLISIKPVDEVLFV